MECDSEDGGYDYKWRNMVAPFEDTRILNDNGMGEVNKSWFLLLGRGARKIFNARTVYSPIPISYILLHCTIYLDFIKGHFWKPQKIKIHIHQILKLKLLKEYKCVKDVNIKGKPGKVK